MKYKAILFDLDGTLVDSIEDLASSCNKVLAARNMPTHHTQEYNYFVGDGLRILMGKIAPKGTADDILDLCCQEFSNYYEECWHEKSQPYPGILKMISSLKEQNIILGILSNKPDAFTQKVVEHFFPEHPFAYIAGQKANIAKKPAPDGAIYAAKQLKVEPLETLFIGDTSVDMQTGKNSGMGVLGVSWGFRTVEELKAHGADYIANTPQEIVNYVCSAH